MVLEWREREHGDVEEAVWGDIMAQKGLRACGLYKFWCLGGLRAKPRLLGSWLRVFPDQRDVPHYRGGGHIFHYWIVLTGRGGEPTLLWARRWPHHWWVYCTILFSGHKEGWESYPDKLHPGTRTEGHTIGTQQDSRSCFTPPHRTSMAARPGGCPIMCI